VTDGESLVERAKAVFVYQAVKVAEKLAAVALVKLRLLGVAADLHFRLATGILIAINNTIALKNATALGIEWKVIPRETLVTQIRRVAIAEQVALFSAHELDTVMPILQKEAQDALNELRTKIEDFVHGVYQKLHDIKAWWESNKERVIAELANRTLDFLENVNRTSVTVKIDAAGNLSLSIKITRDDIVGEVREQVRKYIVDHLKILIVAYLSIKPENVTISVGEPAAAGKRGIQSQSEWGTEVQIGSTNNGIDGSTGSATTVVVSFSAIVVAVVACIAAMF